MRRKEKTWIKKCEKCFISKVESLSRVRVRESNFELLRNLAMFMVLVIHANFVSLPRPLADELVSSPGSTAFRYFIESLGIVCVDVFVLISGWFRVNTNVKSVVGFVFQVLFFWIGGYVACILLGRAEISFDGVLECFAFTRWDWFIKAYVVLLIISPVLNAFVDKASQKQHRNVLIAFFLFQFIYGWIGGGDRFFVNGYGPLSFIGLYLLAQYIRRLSGKEGLTPFNLPDYVDLLIFFVTAFLNTILSLVLLRRMAVNHIIFAYDSPLVVIGALYLLLFFSKLIIKQNKVINWFGASSFAVFLLHSQVDMRRLFTTVIVKLDSMFDGLSTVGVIFLFLIFVYIISVLIDQLRIWLWNLIWNRFGVKNDVCNSY